MAHDDQASILQPSLTSCFSLIDATDGNGVDQGHEDEIDVSRSLSISEWKKFCNQVRQGRVEATCILDFPFADQGENPWNLNLFGDDRLLERMYCFAEPGSNEIRVVLHVHTLLKWGDRKRVPMNRRADAITSVNVRHALRVSSDDDFQQERQKLFLVPISMLDWRVSYGKQDSGRIQWGWRQDPILLPSGEVSSAKTREVYDQIRKVIVSSEFVFDDGTFFESHYGQKHTETLIRGGITSEFEGYSTNGVDVRSWISFVNVAEAGRTHSDSDDQEQTVSNTTWAHFCESVEGRNVEVACVLDFPYRDCSGVAGLNLSEDEAILERVFCFKGTDTLDNHASRKRSVLRVLTLLPWQQRGSVSVADRSKFIISVSFHHGTRTARGWVCEVSRPIIPVADHLGDLPTVLALASGFRDEDFTWNWEDRDSIAGIPKMESTASRSTYTTLKKLLIVGHSLFTSGETETHTQMPTSYAMRGEHEVGYEVVAFRRPVREPKPTTRAETEKLSLLECQSKPKPTAPPSPFGFLIIAASNQQGKEQLKGQGKLDVKREYHTIREALRDERGVLWEHYETADAVDLVVAIDRSELQPLVVLHIVCHGENDSMELQESTFDAPQLSTAIDGHNTGRKTSSPIQLLVLNMCDSEPMMQHFAGVDFVIGHRGKVADSAAITFSKIFYQKLGCGISVFSSFWQARDISKSPYVLQSQKDATRMYFFCSEKGQSVTVQVQQQATLPPGQDTSPTASGTGICQERSATTGLNISQQDFCCIDSVREHLQGISSGIDLALCNPFMEAEGRLLQSSTDVAAIAHATGDKKMAENTTLSEKILARDVVQSELFSCAEVLIRTAQEQEWTQHSLDSELSRLPLVAQTIKREMRDDQHFELGSRVGSKERASELEQLVSRFDEAVSPAAAGPPGKSSEEVSSDLVRLVDQARSVFLEEVSDRHFRTLKFTGALSRAKALLEGGREPHVAVKRRFFAAQKRWLETKQKYKLACIQESYQAISPTAVSSESGALKAQLVSCQKEMEEEWNFLYELADGSYPELPKSVFEEMSSFFSHNMELPSGGRIFQPFHCWDDYQMECQLSRAGDGSRHSVWKVSRDSQIVVLKQFDLGGSNGSVELQNLKVMQKEVNSLLRMEHPNVIKPMVFFLERDSRGLLQGFVQFPFYPGESMEQWLETGEARDEKKVLVVLLDLLRGLDHVHYHKVVHCDVKPGNVFLGPLENGCRHAVLADFELSKDQKERNLQSVKSSVQSVLGPRGTPGVLTMAPELDQNLMGGKGPTVQSDMYSFGGVVLRAMYPEQSRAWAFQTERWDDGGMPKFGFPCHSQVLTCLLSSQPGKRPISSEVLEREQELFVRPRTVDESREQEEDCGIEDVSNKASSGENDVQGEIMPSGTVVQEPQQSISDAGGAPSQGVGSRRDHISAQIRQQRVPPNWDPTRAGLHYVEDSTLISTFEEWMTRTKCEAGFHCRRLNLPEVQRVIRVESVPLWRMYKAAATNLEDKALEWQHKGLCLPNLQNFSSQVQPKVEMVDLNSNVNEMFLFHGTTKENALLIADHGLDERIAKTTGLYGVGCYFSDQFCKAHQYAEANVQSEEYVVVVCRVLMGWPNVTSVKHPEERRASLNPETPGRPFDSVFAGAGIGNFGKQVHNEFVVYDGNLAYPEWLVHYRKKPIDPAVAREEELQKRFQELEAREAALLTSAHLAVRFPPYWQNGGRGVHLEPLEGPAKSKMQDWMRKTGLGGPTRADVMLQCTVTKVLRVENGGMWQQYQTKKEVLKEEHREWKASGLTIPSLKTRVKQPAMPFGQGAELSAELNELFLFHGTSYDTAHTIAHHGFDERVASLQGLYGAGSYFADNSWKPNQFAQISKTRQGEHVLLLCRVTMGWAFATGSQQRQLRRPPNNPSLCNRPYDSIFAASGVASGGMQAYNEFVVFDKTQVYPEYLICYKI